jgi:hypothetical protein
VPTITVCIPAYHVGSFIEETLDSVLAQSFGDFVVEIAVEPPAAEILRAVEPFLADSRFRTVENPARLGWDANIAAQLNRVQTPYFTVLPHDDKLHPEFFAKLLPAVEGRPDATIAYCDTQRFGGDLSPVTLDLPEWGTADERLLAFYLGGAEGTPWRGVARSAVIQTVAGFPVDGHCGFAVECEWVLSLLLAGPTLRVAEPLYLKRIHLTEVMSASRARLRDRSREQLLAAMARHRARMLAPVPSLRSDTATGRLLPLAAEAAMVHRHVQQLRVLSQEQVAESEQLMQKLNALVPEDPRADRALALLRTALARHARHSS